MVCDRKGGDGLVNIDKLKGAMTERRMNVETLAKMLGMDRATLYRKMNQADGETFTIREANQIIGILGLSLNDAEKIFFAQFVAPDAN